MLLVALFLSGCGAARSPTPNLAAIPFCQEAVAQVERGIYVVNECVMRQWTAGRRMLGVAPGVEEGSRGGAGGAEKETPPKVEPKAAPEERL